MIGNINDLIASLDLSHIDMDYAKDDVRALVFADVPDLSSAGDCAIERLLANALPQSVTILDSSGDILALVSSKQGRVYLVRDGSVMDGNDNTSLIYKLIDGGGNVVATFGVSDDIAITATPIN